MKIFVPLFSITLFLSAFLLFAIQPLFSKMVLPYLGGSPMVWNTAMVFFQGALLAGYGYAYFVSKIPRVGLQILIHLALFLLFLVFLPFSIHADDIPESFDNPTLWQIGLMLATIGPPFFILSGCAPLLQRWFSHSQHISSSDPYFLYAASNVGSMLALLGYPFIIEPLFGIYEQANIWSGLYAALILLIALCGVLVLRYPYQNLTEEEKSVRVDAEPDVTPTWRMRGFWLLLAFVPSSLMLGVTTYLTTDIASVPLLWVIPLAIYVGTFIIAFANKRPLSTHQASILHMGMIIALFITMFIPFEQFLTLKFIAHLILFSAVTLSCHMRLADNKPRISHLTEFYFIMSLGGVCGGIFNALIAPVIFVQPWEYTLVIILSVFLIDPKRLMSEVKEKNFLSKVKTPDYIAFIIAILMVPLVSILNVNQAVGALVVISIIFTFALVYIHNVKWLFAACTTFTLLALPVHDHFFKDAPIHITRNFFGITKVYDNLEEEVRMMLHGTTMHGIQSLNPNSSTKPLGYYHEATSIGQAFRHFTKEDQKDNVAVLGLGTGGVACYTAPGRQFHFFEIDPEVAALTTEYNLFSYLDDCGNPYKITIGDARLKLNDIPDNNYGFLMVDVFSSDNIPVHLMTEEAVRLYLSKLKDDGAILVHISNRHISLLPVLATITKELGVPHLYKITSGSKDDMQEEFVFPTSTFLIAKKPEVLAPLKEEGWSTYENTGSAYHWKDNYANILNTLNLVLGFNQRHFNEVKAHRKQQEELEDRKEPDGQTPSPESGK